MHCYGFKKKKNKKYRYQKFLFKDNQIRSQGCVEHIYARPNTPAFKGNNDEYCISKITRINLFQFTSQTKHAALIQPQYFLTLDYNESSYELNQQIQMILEIATPLSFAMNHH